jgi:rhamnogalacturonan endolyase
MHKAPFTMRSLWVTLLAILSPLVGANKGPFLEKVGDDSWVIGNDLWNVTQGPLYATKLFWQGIPGADLVGSASGHYAGYGRFLGFAI